MDTHTNVSGKHRPWWLEWAGAVAIAILYLCAFEVYSSLVDETIPKWGAMLITIVAVRHWFTVDR